MLFENPLIADLHLLTKALTGLKDELKTIEKTLETKSSVQLSPHLDIFLSQIKLYTEKEFALFAKDEISQSTVNLLKELSSKINLDAIRDYLGIRKNFPLQQLKELIAKIDEETKKIAKTELEVKFELQQKRKARRLAQAEVNVKKKGCYHIIPINRLLSIMQKGIVSIDYAQRELDLKLAMANENFQGTSYISVFDPYSYWKLYRYFLAKKTLARIMKGTLTEEDLQGAFKSNKDLNMSKFAEININLFKDHHAFNSPGSMFLEPFTYTMASIADNRLYSYVSAQFYTVGNLVLIINDTAEMFPDHDNAYNFEARFKDKIAPDKIVGIIFMPEQEQYHSVIKEIVKFAGLPLYNSSGRLIWPTS